MRCLNCDCPGLTDSMGICPCCHLDLTWQREQLLTPGTILASTYRIGEPLGRGAFGIVYKSAHLRLKQDLAIKEFYPERHAMRDPSSRAVLVMDGHENMYKRLLEQFIDEGSILARIRHPNVVIVQSLVIERNTAYLVMDLLAGHSLEAELAARPGRRLPPDRVVAMMDQLVAGLSAVHDKGICHRDLKPQNVMITPKGQAVLIDFSVQAITDEYAPPELRLGRAAGPESDLFELGMMLHEMLTGKLPPPVEDWPEETWRPVNLEPLWVTAISAALYIERNRRPASVRTWWEPFRSPAPSPPEPKPTRPLRISASGWTALRLSAQHHSAVCGITVSSKNALFASAGGDDGIFIWDGVAHCVQHNVTTPVSCLAFNPAGGELFSGSRDGQIYSWQPDRNWQSRLIASESQTRIWALTFSADGNRLIWVDDAGSLWIWDMLSRRKLRQLYGGFHLFAVACSAKGNLIAAGGDAGVIQLWDEHGRALSTLHADSGRVRALAFHPRGLWLASAHQNGTVMLWDPANNAAPLHTLPGPGAGVCALAFHPNGTWLAGTQHHAIQVWELPEGLPVALLESGEGSPVTALAFSQRGDQLLAGSQAGSLTAWQVTNVPRRLPS